MGIVDSAGCSAVHLVGGISGLVATLYLKPRRHRFQNHCIRQISNPTKAILGQRIFKAKADLVEKQSIKIHSLNNLHPALHMNINCGGNKYRSAVGTILASAGGGMITVLISRWATKKIQVDMLIDAGCLFYTPYQATLVGAIGSAMALVTYPLLEKAKVYFIQITESILTNYSTLSMK
ncbi:hypothetical protein DICVIV_04364 [Dictyocaulus viviparus]|uniref:Ammonium transporter AmtB-like domain-containing protein n=1 Tax=Dictyocaulus viviparus TaxID=29172 RepID=A0A0D8XYB2_DICVI|nr:hypothetical protein DICVIV_04364 [Dictyocaulus viviparus]